MLDTQIEMAVTDQEKAKLCCYKARNLRKLNQPDMAEQDYLEALELANTGWILNEYSNFLYKTGEFERTDKAASRVIEDFRLPDRSRYSRERRSHRKLRPICGRFPQCRRASER